MVNKILKVGNQIVSVGNGVVNTPNPELEVNQMPDSSEVSAYIVEDVQKGEILFRSRTVRTPKYVRPGGYSYIKGTTFFERDGDLHVLLAGRDSPEIHRYDGSSWNPTGAMPKAFATKGWWTGWRDSGPYVEFDDDGRMYIAAGLHVNPYGPYCPQWYKEEELGNGLFQSKHMPLSTSSSLWPEPEKYAEPNYYRSCEGFAWKNYEGSTHACIIYQPSSTWDGNTYSTNFYGKGMMKTYTVDLPTGEFTLTDFEPSCPFVSPNFINFGEASGTLFLIVGDNNAYSRTTMGLDTSYTNSYGQTFTTPSNVTIAIWAWDKSLNKWVFLQWDEVYQGGTNHARFKNLEDGSFVLERTRGGGYNNQHAPLKFNNSTSSFEEWGYLTASDNGYSDFDPPSIFYASSNYYMVVGCRARYGYFDGGHSYPYNVSSSFENSFLKTFKYNSSTNFWELLPNQPSHVGSIRVHSGDPNSTRGTRGVESITHNGEIHVFVGADDYGPESKRFFKFDVSTESLVDVLPRSEKFIPDIHRGYLFAAPEITYNSKRYKLVVTADFPRLHLLEYQTSGDSSGTWEYAGNKRAHSPDIGVPHQPRTGYLHTTASGLFAILPTYISGGNSFFCYEWDFDESQFKKVADDEFWDSGATKLASHAWSSTSATLSGLDYIFAQSYNDNDIYIYNVSESASGVPLLVNASAPTVNFLGGNSTQADMVKSKVYDGKIWLAVAHYNAPYVPFVGSWDGSSAAWTEYTATLPVHGVDFSAVSSTNRIQRCRSGPLWFEYDDDLYLVMYYEQYPRGTVWRYNPTTDKFDQTAWFIHADTGFGNTTQRDITINEPVTWNNKVWWLSNSYDNYTDPALLHSYDPATSALNSYVYHSSHMVNANSETYGCHIKVSDDGTHLEVWSGGYYHSGGAKTVTVFKITQSDIDNYGNRWLRYAGPKLIEDPVRLPRFAVALESGSANSSIKIREISLG